MRLILYAGVALAVPLMGLAQPPFVALTVEQKLALHTKLHQDPRYFRSTNTGFWRRSGHALRGTILTRTDKGAETLSTWRLGSAYGAAFISNQWYPDRLNTVGLGLAEGSVQIGFDLLRNLGLEFWPDIKRKVFHRKLDSRPTQTSKK